MLFGMGLFTLASLLCGMAQSMEQRVLARIIQGIGAGADSAAVSILGLAAAISMPNKLLRGREDKAR